MSTLAAMPQQGTTSMGLVKKTHSSTQAKQICRVCHENFGDDAVRKAQQIWDAYFAKMLATFHELNPDLNRDLALDRTVRALGQRPQTAAEQANSRPMGGPSAICIRNLGASCPMLSRQESKLQRMCAQEDSFEELCSLAFDA